MACLIVKFEDFSFNYSRYMKKTQNVTNKGDFGWL